MKFFAKVTDILKIEVDLLAVVGALGTKERAVVLGEDAQRVDVALNGELSEIAKSEEFEAKLGNSLLLHSHSKIPAKRVLLVGLGDLIEFTMADWQTVVACIGRRSKDVKAAKVAVVLPDQVVKTFGAQRAAQGLVEGLELGTYKFLRHKSEALQKKEKFIDEAYVLTKPARLNAVSKGVEQGQAIARGVVLARDLVNEPPSMATPTHLAQIATSIAKGAKNVSCEIYGLEDIKKIGMGALLGVARGSEEEPKFIKLTYGGGGRKTICLVGKGVTFDTGGLSLKSGKSMETMKLDMAGAATILGVFSVLAKFAPRVNVVGLISATENMPSDKAIKPGDVVTAMNGKTIEVLNTDAEGRLVLADAFSYAGAKLKPDTIIDIATLTGACVVALGEDIAGLFSNDVKLAQGLKEAADRTGEHMWGMPLFRGYKNQFKSTIADFKNISGTRYGGAINGALFLEEFVPKGVQWAHLDIAGPAFAEKDAPLTPIGGTGFGVRLILDYLQSL